MDMMTRSRRRRRAFRRRKISPRQERLLKISERAHARVNVLQIGVAEALKQAYDTTQIRNVLDIAAADLLGACAASEEALAAFEYRKKNPRIAKRRDPATVKPKARKSRAGGNA